MTPEEQAKVDIAQENAIRELAVQIGQMTKSGVTPATIRKGVIAAIDDSSTPPTVSINISGDATTLVTEVRTLDNFSPVVNQTVLVAKQGSEIFILGSIASAKASGAPTGQTESTGWTKPDLSNGTHGGSGNDIYYRRILDHGSWKIQWRGTWNTSGSSTMIDTALALEPDYRPSASRQIACARENDGAVTVRMDFTTAGLVTLHQGTPGISSTSTTTSFEGSHSHGFNDVYGDIGQFTQGNSTFSSGGHDHSSGSHSHGGTVQIDHPNWVSLNGVEYFL